MLFGEVGGDGDYCGTDFLAQEIGGRGGEASDVTCGYLGDGGYGGFFGGGILDRKGDCGGLFNWVAGCMAWSRVYGVETERGLDLWCRGGSEGGAYSLPI